VLGLCPFGWGRRWPLKHAPPYVLPCRIWSFCVKGCSVRINRKELQKLGSTGTPPLGVGRGWPLKTSPSHMCYHVKFGCSVSKGVCINRREPKKNWGALGPRPLVVGVWLSPEIPRFPTSVILPNLVVLCQTVRSLLRSAWKYWPPLSRLSRSFKVAWTDTDRSATYDFLCSIATRRVSYRFRDKRQLQSKTAIFHGTVYLRAH